MCAINPSHGCASKMAPECEAGWVQVRRRNSTHMEDVQIPKNVKAIVILNLQAT